MDSYRHPFQYFSPEQVGEIARQAGVEVPPLKPGGRRIPWRMIGLGCLAVTFLCIPDVTQWLEEAWVFIWGPWPSGGTPWCRPGAVG